MCGIFGYVGARTDAPGPRPARAEAARVPRLRLLGHRGPQDGQIAAWRSGSARSGRPRPPCRPAASGSGTPAGRPTAASPTQNAHPHLDCTRRLAIIHNGIVAEPRRAAPRAASARGHTLPIRRPTPRSSRTCWKTSSPAARRRPDGLGPGADGGVPSPGRAERHRRARRRERLPGRRQERLAADARLGRATGCCWRRTTRRCSSTPAG